LLRDGLAWLEQQRTAHMTSPVEYRRAGQPAKEVQATFGKTDYEVADDYGATIAASAGDFLILAEELGIEPEAGDIIAAPSTSSGQAGRRYEVMNLAGQSCWRWSDPYRTTLRIHTKDVGADAP
jgi:hypothetical protein